MKKAVVFASLAIITSSVFGMYPNNINSVNNNGNIPFLTAIVKNDTDKIRDYIKNNNVDMICQNDDGNNAIMLALSKDNFKLAGNMLNQLNNSKIVQLMTSGKNKNLISTEGIKPIRSWSHINDKNKKGETLLDVAINKNAPERIIKNLIDLGTDINEKNVQGAIDRYGVAFANCLLECADITVKETFLFRACESANLDIVKFLVEHGTDVNKDDGNGRTPLSYAVYRGYENIVKYLVEHGTDINKTDKQKATALCWASYYGHEGIVKYLVEHGADVNTIDYKGNAALTLASEKGLKEIVQYLVEHGADINKKNKKGATPLHIACEKGHEDVVKYLVEHGAEITENVINYTPSFPARKSDNENIVKYLKAHDAK